jgi:hypothetical protein
VFVPQDVFWQIQPGHNYTVQIYKGGIWGAVGERNPGTKIVSQELNNVNLLFNKENAITLDTTVTIDATQELWIGYYCTNIDSVLTDKFPAGSDPGPRKEGLGNVWFFKNQWTTLNEVYAHLDYNFCIKGIVQTTDGATVNIYYNDGKLKSDISGTTYFHDKPEGEEQCYKVEVNQRLQCRH